MPIEKGDFVLVDYKLMLQDTRKIIDTTIREEAEKAGIAKENALYEPVLVIVGEGFLLKSLEEELIGLEQGQEKEIILPPEKAFGKRDPNNVKVFSAKEFSMRGVVPRVNMEVEIGGRRGTIISIGGGRVIVDFNHPLAGRTLVYDVRIVKVLSSKEEEIAELFHRWIRPIRSDELKVSIKDSVATLEVPERLFSISNVGMLLRGFIRDLSRYVGRIEKILITAEFAVGEKEPEVKAEAQPQQRPS